MRFAGDVAGRWEEHYAVRRLIGDSHLSGATRRQYPVHRDGRLPLVVRLGMVRMSKVVPWAGSALFSQAKLTTLRILRNSATHEHDLSSSSRMKTTLNVIDHASSIG